MAKHMLTKPNAVEHVIFDMFDDVLEALPGSPENRNKAMADLRAQGLPTRRVEAWHYTDLRALLKDMPAIAKRPGVEAVGEVQSSFQAQMTRLPMFDGCYFADLADMPPEGVTVEGLFESLKSGNTLAGPRNAMDTIGRINTAFAGDGVRVDIAPGITLSKPVGLVHVGVNGEAVSSHVRHEIQVGAKSKARFIETYDSAQDAQNLSSAVIFLDIEAGAEVDWLVVQQHGRQATHLGQIRVRLGANARFNYLVVNSGGALVRQEIIADVVGEGAHAEISGLNLVDDKQHFDVTLDLTHSVPNTTSNQTFKSVVRNSAKAIFQGRIAVEAIAQKTDAKMMAQGLMLSEGAQILTKPELEIFADDVQCGHGSTCGELDADTLFYLMSRGIPKAEASSMLIRAFVQELLDPIEDETLNASLSSIVSDWLDKGETGAI